MSALAGGGVEGENPPHRRKIWYEFPSIKKLCNQLDIELFQGDPIFAKDLQSAKDYRQALEREFIKRRPGQYTQCWLASRLSISDRTIRRYHKTIPIQSRQMYDERLIHRWNIETLPYDDDRQGGWTLIDRRGKVYPASREIAQRLLRQGHEIHLRIQQGNFYWYGDLEPQKEYHLDSEYVKEPVYPPIPIATHQAEQRNPISEETRQSVTIDKPVLQPDVETVYVRSLDLLEQSFAKKTPTTLQADRYYLQPLENSYQEYVAQDVYANIEALSIYNARRLVDLYGLDVVKATLSKTVAMMRKGKISNPAGFMVTATQVAWRENHGYDKFKPEFKVQPPRRERQKPYDLEKDPLTKSEGWLRWRIQFAYQMGDVESIELWQARLQALGLPEEKFTDLNIFNKGELPY